MTYEEITELYFSIGKTFRSMGAEMVYLLYSKPLLEGYYEMELEIMLDTEREISVFQTEARAQWPKVRMTVSRIIDHMDRFEEIKADSVIL